MTLFQISLQHAVRDLMHPEQLTAFLPVWTLMTRATGLMAFVFVGAGVTMVGHAWRLLFKRGGVLDVSTENIHHVPEEQPIKVTIGGGAFWNSATGAVEELDGSGGAGDYHWTDKHTGEFMTGTRAEQAAAYREKRAV